MKFTKSQRLQKISHSLIPGGAHTYSKGDDQFPKLSPGFIARGKGAYVWDPDNNKFLDWGMGLRSTILGHGYKPIITRVKKQLPYGANYTRPSTLEIELAKLLTSVIPCGEMVKFAKNGSTVTTAAVKLARAYTKRDLVAVCSDQAFTSYDDWFIATTPIDAGVPKLMKRFTVGFKYNNVDSVREMFRRYPKQIACLIFEPATEFAPKNNFLSEVQKLCRRNGTLLIFDEMISGFRYHLKGAQHIYGIVPDMATYGKAIANGFSMAVLAGKKKIMELGGLRGKHERVFLISTTHGAENHALVAAMATIQEIKKKNVIRHLNRIGVRLQKSLNDISRKHKLNKIINVFGAFPSRLAVSFQESAPFTGLEIKTYFLQELISRRILFNGYFAPSYSHTLQDVEKTARAWNYACQKIAVALKEKTLKRKIVGPIIKPVFRKFN